MNKQSEWNHNSTLGISNYDLLQKRYMKWTLGLFISHKGIISSWFQFVKSKLCRAGATPGSHGVQISILSLRT